jgi:hypothetical protein
MFTLKAQAETLMAMPTEDGTRDDGPTFEHVPRQSSSLTAMAR